MYRRLVNLSKVIRWLSLDIALGGAILISFVSGSIYSLSLPISVVISLVVAILMIYTADHLIDASRIKQPTMSRHQFHKRHGKSLSIYLLLLGLIGSSLLFYLPKQLIYVGAIMALGCGLYLLVNHYLSRKGTKELVVAVIYAGAMFLYPFSLIDFGFTDLLLLLELFFLAYSNLLIISFFEHQEDLDDETSSVAHVIGNQKTLVFTLVLVLSNILLTVVLWSYSVAVPFQVFILCASLVYLIIVLFQRTFRAHERYRWASDLVFILPILYL